MPALKEEWLFFYPADFLNVAKDGNQTVQTRIDAETHFICLGLQLGVYFNSSVSLTTTAGLSGLATLAGMQVKLNREGSPLAAVNSNGHLGHIKIKVQTNDRPWTADAVRADMITGEPGKMFLLPKPIFVNANSSILSTLFNNLPASVGGASNPPVDAQLVFVGYKRKI